MDSPPALDSLDGRIYAQHLSLIDIPGEHFSASQLCYEQALGPVWSSHSFSSTLKGRVVLCR